MFLVCFLFVLSFPDYASAYVDPGTGSLLFQVVTAALLGFGLFWRRVKAFFCSLFGKKSCSCRDKEENS
ncbi:MAG: hypothetical protein LBJ70_00175 [Holosporales bacterium]|jgi:hypothetical protein|nr:hypothetical protein [Holosporales bacterium]